MSYADKKKKKEYKKQYYYNRKNIFSQLIKQENQKIYDKKNFIHIRIINLKQTLTRS